MPASPIDALREALEALFPGERVVGCEPLGADAGARVFREEPPAPEVTAQGGEDDGAVAAVARLLAPGR